MKARNNLNKFIRRILFILITCVILGGIASYFAQKWLEYHLVDILNENESRAYDITYEHLDLNPSFKGFKLENVSIQPKNKFKGTIINCRINRVKVNGLNWRDLAFRGQANIKEISFVSPDFVLTMAEGDTSKAAPSKEVQQFFGDVLSRVRLRNFRLIDGAFIWYEKKEKLMEVGHVGNISFEAKDIETDSVQWKNIIPFKLGELSSIVEDIVFHVDKHSTLRCSSMVYNPKQSNIILSNLSLKLNKGNRRVSRIKGKQCDIFEFDLKQLSIYGLGANSDLYENIDIRSEALIIEGLVLKDYKNKNQPAIDGNEKPMFSKMIASIPIDLNIDTILIKNSAVKYTEVGKGKSKEATIHLDKLNGSIYGFTTLDSLQTVHKTLHLNISGAINGTGNLKVNFNIPYEKDAFRLKAQLEDFEMPQLNSTIKPMLGIAVESGHISLLDFDMRANNRQSNNKMILHYTGLKLSVLEDDKGNKMKRGLVSGLANSLMRASNLPGDKNYIIANFKTRRNIYKAPFNFVWCSVQDGLKEIIPSKMAKELMAMEGLKAKADKNKSKKKRQR